MKKEQEKPTSSYPKSVRIIAMIGVILLLAMYVITFISAVTTSPATPQLFKMCVGGSIFIPCVLWLNVMLARMASGRTRREYEMQKAAAEELAKKEKDKE